MTPEVQHEHRLLIPLCPEKALAVPRITTQQWADQITHAHRKTVEAILDTGRLLLAAKAKLRHGEFMKLFRGSHEAVTSPVPFGIGMAERFMQIARHPILSNSSCSTILPSSVSTLAALARLKVPTLEYLLKRRIICPELTCKRLARFVRDATPLWSPAWGQCSNVPQVSGAMVNRFEMSEEVLWNYRNEVDAALREPLQIDEAGKILSGVCWVPPFVNVALLPRKPEPKVRHRCECGHEHVDQRTK